MSEDKHKKIVYSGVDLEGGWVRAVPPAEAHCATCGCVPGMTPAIRFDTTPAERDGVVRDHLIRMGWTPPAEVQAQGDDFYENSYIRQKAATRNVSGHVVECRICENVHNDDDARLIAAAPELYEALEDLVEQCGHPNISGWVDIKRAIAALTHCRGEEA